VHLPEKDGAVEESGGGESRRRAEESEGDEAVGNEDRR
jgi:hypothetical protein